MKYSLTIIGGYGDMGIWLLNFLKENNLINEKFEITRIHGDTSGGDGSSPLFHQDESTF